ncbi:hypothetical protein FHR71_001755 [Methylobacterium sp. RAS18]|nr:hypothetical protein [Methylobacterium sp. RAS18]
MAHAVSNALLTFAGEPRVSEADLASALGYPNARKVRELVKRNLTELLTYGDLPPVREMYLNEAQALLICMFSRTPSAAKVRKTLIETFTAWRSDAATLHKPSSAPSSSAAFAVERAWSVGSERYWIDFHQDRPSEPMFVDMCLPTGMAAKVLNALADGA